MTNWFDELHNLIQREIAIGEEFTLDRIYEYEDRFRVKFPENQHVRDKLRQTLQKLRDSGTIEFIDNRGTYRRVT